MTTDERGRRRLSLRALLLLTLAAALSPVLVIGGIRWSGDIEREAHYRRETMTLVARVAAGRTDSQLASAPAILDLIGTRNSNPCQLPLREIVDALPDFTNLGAVDASGQVICSSQEGAVGLNVSDRAWFQALRDGKDYAQSAAVLGAVSRQWTVVSAVRRTAPDGSFAGAMSLSTSVNSLVAQLAHGGLPQGYEIALLDQSGRVFASSHWEMLDPELVAGLPHDKPKYFELKSNKGESRQVATVALAGTDLRAIASAPTPPPIALENVSAFGNFALPLLAWLLALVTAWLATDRLVLRWLDYLARIAGLYASGKLSVQPLRAKQQAPVEINMLADTMEEMAVRIRDRTGRMEAALTARDAAIKEIHHRVKNNLQIINSLLSLQGRKLKDSIAAAALDDARARINALSLIHTSLYEHNNVRTVEARSFFAELARNLGQSMGAADLGIRVEADVDQDAIDADIAVPLALFAAEAVTNAIKHAFLEGDRNEDRSVRLTYSLQPGEAVLSVEDNGSGYEEGGGGAEPGLGGNLMAAFAKQVQGKLETGTPAGGGRYIRIRFVRPPPSETPAPEPLGESAQ